MPEPSVTICRTPIEHTTRKPDGEVRWCFICRARRAFEFVVAYPPLDSYYEPLPSVHCAVCDSVDGDVFPGRCREWE